MARYSKVVDLGDNDKTVVIYALRVRDITELSPIWADLFENFSQNKALGVSNDLLKRCSNLDWETIQDLTFHDLEKIEEVFREVNAPFLKRYSQGKSLLDALGMKKLLETGLDWLVKNAEIFSENSLAERRKALLGSQEKQSSEREESQNEQ